MKKRILTTILLLTVTLTFACSCDYGGNFIYSSYLSSIVVKGKVVTMFYHFADGKKIDSKNQKEFEKYLITREQQFYESIQVEINDLIKGKENRRVVEIFGSDGSDCRAGVRDFEIGKEYIFSLNYTTDSYSDLPNEKDNDFILRGCFESWLEYKPKTNEVRGLIKGKSFRKRNRNYSYEKLIEKIT